MLTIAKFVLNDKPGSKNPLVSKTFGKLGVPHRESVEAMPVKPQHNEWWYCEIVKEIGAGTGSGIFLLKPLRKVELIRREGIKTHDIAYLVPGMYRQERQGNVLLLYPNKKGPNWICPSTTKKHLMSWYRREGSYNINSIIVVHDDADDWPKVEPKGYGPVVTTE